MNIPKSQVHSGSPHIAWGKFFVYGSSSGRQATLLAQDFTYFSYLHLCFLFSEFSYNVKYLHIKLLGENYACQKETGVKLYPIIQAPPVINATTGFGPSLFLGKYKSSLRQKFLVM